MERAVQMQELNMALNNDLVNMPLCVVYGIKNSGKSKCVLNLTHALKNQHVIYVNMSHITNNSELFSTILKSLKADARDVGNLNAFLDALEDIAFRYTKVSIVLDHVDTWLEQNDGLDGLLKIASTFDKASISMVLVVRGISNKLKNMVKGYVPLYVYFSPFERKYVIPYFIKTLTLEDKHDVEMDNRVDKVDEVYKTWIARMYGILARECSDWKEIQYWIVQLTPVVANFIKQQGIDKDLMRKLNTFMEPYVKFCLKNMFHHVDIQEKLKAIAPNSKTRITKVCEFPERTICMIVASFLASYNPPDSDAMYFTDVASAGKKRKRRKVVKHVTISQHLLGPTAFPLQRLLAIYQGLLRENVMNDIAESDSTMHLQIDHLVQMHLLTRITARTELSNIWMRCNADFEYVNNAAKQMDIHLSTYLHQLPGSLPP